MWGGNNCCKAAEFAVAAGVGAAVLTGWGCAVASADDSVGSSTHGDASPASTGGGAAASDENARASPDEADGDESLTRDNSLAGNAEEEAAESFEDAAEPDEPASEAVHAPEPAASEETTDVVVDTPADAPTVKTDVTAPEDNTDNPPAAPAVTPPLRTLTAAARREFDADVIAPATYAPVGAVTTSETLDAADGNSIVYTDGSTPFERMVVASLRVIRNFSSFIGVDLYGQIAKLSESHKPPLIFRHGLDVRRTEYEVSDGNVWKVWEFHPPNPTGKTVVAVHGGGFVVQPLATHWLDYTNMARATGATVLVPMYPLASTAAGTANRVVPAMAQYLSDQIARYGAENVSVYADSAGPTLALAAVRELILNGEPVPASMVLLSFAPDSTLSNPDIYEIDDPVIDVDNLDFYTKVNHWSDGLEKDDPMLSPLFFEDEVFAAIPKTTIYVGSLEWVLPDTLLLHEKWSAAGGVVSTVVGKGQYHDWALDGSVNSQTARVRPDIYRELGLNGVAAGPRTITTGPPSFWDRLIVRMLQTLRRNAPEVYNGDPSGLTGATPPWFVRHGLTVTESEFNGWAVWELAPKTPSGEYVLALHGGGFVVEANVINWADYASMARDTGATVLVPAYPLAPPIGNATVPTLIPPMADYLAMLIDEHGADNVSLYGDSAGGTFAMLTAQELLRRCRSDVQCVLSEAQPSRMVLISPILHLTLTGPIVDDIDDPIIPRTQLSGHGQEISGGLSVFDLVNPIARDDLTGLPPTAVYVGTIERPYPGDLAFRDKLLTQDPDADFTVIIGDGQLHDWALGGIFVNSQARLWRSTVYRQLGLLPDNPADSARYVTVTGV